MRHRAALLALLLVALLGAGRAAAQGDPALYTVSDFEVFAEAEDGVKAKNEALAGAAAAAFPKLASRITLGGDVPMPGPAEAERMTSSLSFSSEAVGATSYRATLTVRFDRNAVVRYLGRHGITAVETAAPPVLVVPVLIEGGRALLWDDAVPWQAALAAQDLDGGLAPIRLPDNGRGDREIEADRLLDLASLEMTGLRMRHNVHSVVLAIAEPGDEAVRLTLRGEDGAGIVDAAYDVPGGLEEAAAEVAALIETRWKRVVSPARAPAPEIGALRGGFESGDGPRRDVGPEPLRVRVVLRPGESWEVLRRRLEGNPGIAGLALDHVEPGLAEVRIWPSTGAADLSSRLGRAGIDLFRAGDSWMMQAY